MNSVVNAVAAGMLLWSSAYMGADVVVEVLVVEVVVVVVIDVVDAWAVEVEVDVDVDVEVDVVVLAGLLVEDDAVAT